MKAKNRISYLFKAFLSTTVLLTIAFTTGGGKSEYTIPSAAYSINTGDIDLDGDIDIIVGHNYNSQTGWGGISILKNFGDGYFAFSDSIYLYSWQVNTYAINTNNTIYPEIIARHFENNTQYIAVLEYIEGNYYSHLF